MKNYRFKPGDKVRIVDRQSHCFPVGSIVTVESKNSGDDAWNLIKGTLVQMLFEHQFELAEPQEEIVEITELNAEQYYGRVGMIVKYHHSCSFRDYEFLKGIKIVKKSSTGNLVFLDLESNEEHILYIDEHEGVTIKFTDNKQLNQQTMKSKEEIYEAMQAEWLRITGLKVGDYVKCTRNWEIGEQGFSYDRVTGSLVEKTQRIVNIKQNRIELQLGSCFPFFTLEPVEAPEKNYELEDNTRTVTIKEDGSIECGCLKLSKADAVKALKTIEELHNIFKGYGITLIIDDSHIDMDDVDALKKLLK